MTTELTKAAPGNHGAIHETDLYDFAGWLTTRPGVMAVGSSCEAGPMAEAVGEYIKTFPERFAITQRPAAQTDRDAFERWYVDHCPDITCEPIGSRLFTLQWEAWQSALTTSQPAQAGEVDASFRPDLSGYDAFDVLANGCDPLTWQARASLPTQPAAQEACAHRWSHFGDQQPRRRCIDCNTLEPAAQATPEPSRGMIGMGAHALANELAQAVAQDDADPDGHDMSAGLFGPNVSAWLRKISAEYLSQPATPEPVGEAGTMPGTSGFTMACFHADKVPVGTKLYATRPAPGVPEGFTIDQIADACVQAEISDSKFESLSIALAAQAKGGE